MVHYIRFLKTARIERRTSKSLSVSALITITTDLGDTFLLSDLNLISCLVTAEDPQNVLCRSEVHWHRGCRELLLNLTAYIGQSAPLLQLHVFHDKASVYIPSVLEAWSATFKPVVDSRNAGLIERQLSLPCLTNLRIWEETGNSIARHIWDAALGCLLCLQDVVSKGQGMPALAEILRGQSLQHINILELGAGCGIVGIALAHWFPNCAVQLTDLPEAQDLLSRNLNQALPATNSSLRSRVLDWDVESDESSLERGLALIIVSDCTYNADSFPDLVRTLTRLSSTSPGVRILIAVKRRHDSEGIFFDLMRDAQMRILENTTIDLPNADSVSDVNPPEVELYLYQYGLNVAG